MTNLWAVHIADNILAPRWLLAGFALLGMMLVVGLWRMKEEEVARTGVLTAVLFIATFIHPPLFFLPGVRVHILLNGIVGLLIGLRAGAAIPIALLFQALLFSHGGLTTLGVNSATMGLPALLAACLFLLLKNLIGLHTRTRRWLLGGLLSFLAVSLTCILYYLVLRFGTIEGQDLQALATIAFLGHIPVIILETILGALLVDFIYKIKPELLGVTYARG